MRAEQPEGGSLAERLSGIARARLAALRQGASSSEALAPAREWQLAAALVALIAAGPLATLFGAQFLTSAARADVRRVTAQTAPRVAAQARSMRERAELAALVSRATLAATLEALARAMPADASLVRLGRNQEGLLEAEVATPDPDKLRAALRREPALAALRDAGQRGGELAIIVSLRETPR